MVSPALCPDYFCRAAGKVRLLPNTNGLIKKTQGRTNLEETGWDEDGRVFWFPIRIFDPPTHTLKGDFADTT